LSCEEKLMKVRRSWVGGLLSLVTAGLLLTVWDASPAAAEPMATNDTRGSTATSARVAEMVREWEERFTEPVVVRTGATATVSFFDRDGKHYEYVFTAVGDERGEPGEDFRTKWNRWQLNRQETRDLQTDGQNAAAIYGIAALVGCKPCLAAAIIEGLWQSLAGTYYGRGNCAQIYFWLTIGEYSGGYCK
jgi:hypothetical protein